MIGEGHVDVDQSYHPAVRRAHRVVIGTLGKVGEPGQGPDEIVHGGIGIWGIHPDTEHVEAEVVEVGNEVPDAVL